MKKLLKYGIASLSLATMGVVATATDVPVFGTVIVHAEDGEVVDATVNHSQEGSVEVVNEISPTLAQDRPEEEAQDAERVEITNTLLKHEILQRFSLEGKLNREAVEKRVWDNILYIDARPGSEGIVLNPDYLNYNFSNEELADINRLSIRTSIGGKYSEDSKEGTEPVQKIDISELVKLPNLRGLQLEETYEQPLSSLEFSTLQPVTHLQLSSKHPVDATNLSQAQQLEFISGRLNNLGSLSTLPHLKHLVVIGSNYNETTSVAELASLIDKGQLETLSFAISSLAELPDFSNLKNLRRLRVEVFSEDDSLQIFDVSKIKNNKQLEELSISHVNPGGEYRLEPIFQLSNSHFLPTLTNLKHLSLNRFTNIRENLGTINQLSHLTSLELTQADLTDVSELMSLTKLERLVLTQNQLTDISYLANLQNLKHITVAYNKLTDIDIFLEKPEFDMIITGNPVVSGEPFSEQVYINFLKKIRAHSEKNPKNKISIPRGGKGGDGGYGISDILLAHGTLFERSLSGELTKPFPAPEDIPQPTPKTLDSAQAPVTVTVSGKDSSAIAGIETSRVTDQAVLAKLPSNLPQVDIELYDIKTVDDKGNFVQITEPATVTLAVDPSRKVSKVFYFLPDTGMVEELEFTRSDDQQTVSFIVTHFSQYGVVYEPVPQTPPADAPKPQTLTVVETRQDENGAVLFTKTHSLVLNPGEEKDLGYNPDRELLVRGGNLYRYGNFEDGATLYFTTRLKPVTTPTSPATPPSAEELAQLADRLEALRQEVVALDKTIGTGHESWIGGRLELVLKNVKAGDLLTYGAYDFVNIEKDLTERLATLKANQTSAPSVSTPASADQVAITRNQLLAQVDQSRLTDAQKGELAVKIAFAETAEELDKLKSELTNLTAPASKPAPASAAKPVTADQSASSITKTLPATGELSTETLSAMGLSLVLFSLGLAKTRKTD